MTNVNRIVVESNKVVRYINSNSIAEAYAKQEAHSAGVYISLAGNPEAICVARFNYGIKETSSVAITIVLDETGKKIFEGDIVDILTENEERGVITYENGGFVVKASTFVVDFMSNINGEDVEVLGNIVDNPELLG